MADDGNNLNEIVIRSIVDLAESVGEFKAKVGELVHDTNARTQRDESVARSLAKLEAIPDRLEKYEQDSKEWRGSLMDRLDMLEDERVAREAQASLWKLLLKSPAVGWMVGIITAAAMYLFGRAH